MSLWHTASPNRTIEKLGWLPICAAQLPICKLDRTRSMQDYRPECCRFFEKFVTFGGGNCEPHARKGWSPVLTVKLSQVLADCTLWQFTSPWCAFFPQYFSQAAGQSKFCEEIWGKHSFLLTSSSFLENCENKKLALSLQYSCYVPLVFVLAITSFAVPKEKLR